MISGRVVPPRYPPRSTSSSAQWTLAAGPAIGTGLLVAVCLLRVPGFTLATLVADAAMSTATGRDVGRPAVLRWRACRQQGVDRGCLGGRLLPGRSGPAGGGGLGLQSGVPGLAHGSLGVHLAHARSVAITGRFFGVP